MRQYKIRTRQITLDLELRPTHHSVESSKGRFRMGWFDKLVRDWNDGGNAFKNTILMASVIGICGFYSPAAMLLIIPATLYGATMNAAGNDGNRVLGFAGGVIFGSIVFGIAFGIGLGAKALFGS